MRLYGWSSKMMRHVERLTPFLSNAAQGPYSQILSNSVPKEAREKVCASFW